MDVRGTQGLGRRRPRSLAQARGLTLIELIIVLAIIGLMAGVAIPTFARLSFFSGDEMQRGARELYALLRATKIYAATYRVNTALGYYDPVAGADQNTAECLRAAAMFYQRPGGNLYIPIVETEGAFRHLPGDTCLFTGPGLSSSRGMRRISVDFSDGNSPLDLWANVFAPSGRVLSDSTVQLFQLPVGFGPETDEVERYTGFTNPDGTRELRTITVNLFASTGRAQIGG